MKLLQKITKTIQVVCFLLAVFIGASAIGFPLTLNKVYELSKGFINPISTLPWVGGSIRIFSAHHTMATQVLSLSWVLSVFLLACNMICLSFIFYENRTGQGDLSNLDSIKENVYSKLFYSFFDPSRFLNDDKNAQYEHKKLGARDLLAVNKTNSINLLNLEFNNQSLKRQLIFSLILLVVFISIFSYSDSMGGFLGKSPITFYVGYPIIIFTLTLYLVELLIYFPSVLNILINKLKF